MAQALRLRHRSEAGVAAIEFALIAPIFLVLAFAVIIYGFYFATYIAIAHAASEGARASVAGVDDPERGEYADAQVRAIFAAYAPILSSDATHLTVQSGPGVSAGLYRVTVSYDLGDRNFSRVGAFLPLPPVRPSVTVTVANGGD